MFQGMWAQCVPSEKAQEVALALLRIKSQERGVQAEMQALRKRNAYILENWDVLPQMDHREHAQNVERLQELGLQLAYIFEQHIKMDRRAGRS